MFKLFSNSSLDERRRCKHPDDAVEIVNRMRGKEPKNAKKVMKTALAKKFPSHEADIKSHLIKLLKTSSDGNITK